MITGLSTNATAVPPIERVIDLLVELGSRLEIVKFKVNERLGTNVLPGCDFCDTNVDSILSRLREVELDDGTVVPLIRPAWKRTRGKIALPVDLKYRSTKHRPSQNVKATKAIILQPNLKNWVQVISVRTGIVIIEPHKVLGISQKYLDSTVVYQVEKGKNFRIFLEHFGPESVNPVVVYIT